MQSQLLIETNYSDELIRRCQAQARPHLVTVAAAVLGAAVDAGLLTLDQVLDLVRSCATADQLGDALCMLAATVPEREPVKEALWIR